MQIIQQSSIFVREAKTFADIHVPMIGMLQGALGSKYRAMAAKCIAVSMDPAAIVLEDLKRSGFTLATVKEGLDLKHCLLVMKSIAQYHASSMILRRQDPDRFQTFLESVFDDSLKKGVRSVVLTTLKSIIGHVEECPGYEKYSKALNVLRETAPQDWFGAFDRDDSGFNVLIHGDLWLNNMMFRYSEEDNEVQEIRYFANNYLSNYLLDLLSQKFQ